MPKVWSNWSGSLKFTPGKLIHPKNEKELQREVFRAIDKKQKIRVVGAGHSSSPLVVTDELLISLEHFKTVERIDREQLQAWTGTGLTVKEGGTELLKHDLSFHNTGDVDIQYLAGAISTGTHGTGTGLQNLSSMLSGCRMICADGEIREYTVEKDGEDLFKAMRVSLGTLGIMTSMRLNLLPAFKLERREWCTHTDHCMANLHELMDQNRNFDFYWYPRSDLVKLRVLNEPGKGMQDISYGQLQQEYSGWAIEVLPKERSLKFDEMEYALPLEAGPECFSEVRKMIKEKYRRNVAWRVLYRTVKADDFYISPCSGRDTVTISLHQNAGYPIMDFFRNIEPVFLHYGGRPHWGKKHTLKAEDISKCYPKLNDFLRVREKMDPEGIYINEHLSKQIFNL